MSTSSGSWRAIEDPGELFTINPKRFSRSSSSTFLSFFRERERERVPTGSNPTSEQSPCLLSGFTIGAYSEFAFGVYFTN